MMHSAADEIMALSYKDIKHCYYVEFIGCAISRLRCIYLQYCQMACYDCHIVLNILLVQIDTRNEHTIETVFNNMNIGFLVNTKTRLCLNKVNSVIHSHAITIDGTLL